MQLRSILEYTEKAPGLLNQAQRWALVAAYPCRLKVQVRGCEQFLFRLFEEMDTSTPLLDMEALTVFHNKIYKTSINQGFYQFALGESKGWLSIGENATESKNGSSSIAIYNFEFFFSNKKHREAFKSRFVAIQNEMDNTREGITIYSDSYTYWEPARYKLPPRSLKTIFIPQELKNSIVATIDSYIASEQDYADKEIPRHFGMVLMGNPGTGKSSLIAALAHHYDRDIYYPDVSTLEKGTELTELIGNIGKRALLVLEDFDTLSAVKSRESKKNKANPNAYMLSKFLNVLDGIVTPPDLMFIITTNHYDSLDSALKRPGRIHLTVKMPYLTQDVFNDITHHFYGADVEFDFDVEGKQIAASVVTNMFASFFNDPEGGIKGLIEYLEMPQE